MLHRSLLASFLASLLPLATGCSGPESSGPQVLHDPCAPLRVAAAADASAEERDGIERALSLWNGALGTHLSTNAADASELPVRFQDAAPVFHGLYDDQRGIVFINRDLVDAHERAVTVAHELGHAFGLPHVPAETRASVMNPNNLAVEPTPADVAAIESLWGPCR